MATYLLKNTATLNGIYDEMELDVISTEVETTLVDGIIVNKIADREVWVNGFLTYTVTLTNTSDLPVTNVSLVDILDPTLITLVSNSVFVNETTTTYTFITNILTVDLPDLGIGETITVEFKVERI